MVVIRNVNILKKKNIWKKKKNIWKKKNWWGCRNPGGLCQRRFGFTKPYHREGRLYNIHSRGHQAERLHSTTSSKNNYHKYNFSYQQKNKECLKEKKKKIWKKKRISEKKKEYLKKEKKEYLKKKKKEYLKEKKRISEKKKEYLEEKKKFPKNVHYNSTFCR